MQRVQEQAEHQDQSGNCHASTVTSTAEIDERSATAPFWPRGWWRMVDTRIGIVPRPGVRPARRADRRLRRHRQGAVRHPDGDRRCWRWAASPAPKSASGCRSSATSAPPRSSPPSSRRPSRTIKLLPAPMLELVTDFTKISNFLYLFIAVDHRRQHPRHGPAGAGQGLPEDLRAARRRLHRGGRRRHRGRHGAGPGRLPHLLLHRGPDHGRRRRRGGDPAVDRLCGDHCSRRRAICSPRCCRR